MTHAFAKKLKQDNPADMPSHSFVSPDGGLSASTPHVVRGNHSILRKIESGQLKVSGPGDKCEQEADRVAAAVMHMGEGEIAARREGFDRENPSHTQRPCPKCRKSSQETSQASKGVSRNPKSGSDPTTFPVGAGYRAILRESKSEQLKPRRSRGNPDQGADRGDARQMTGVQDTVGEPQVKALPSDRIHRKRSRPRQWYPRGNPLQCRKCEKKLRGTSPSDAPPVAAAYAPEDIPGLCGAGKPMPHSIRVSFERRFGADFSGVRVHTDSGAAIMARSLNARAFTAGRDIAFAPGEFDPYTYTGRYLLAHELTHTLQDSSHLPRPALKRSPADGRCPPVSVVQKDYPGECPRISREPGELQRFESRGPQLEGTAECTVITNMASGSADFGEGDVLLALDDILRLVGTSQNAVVVITGYTDCITQTGPQVNRGLRIERAYRVARFMTAQLGLPRDKVRFKPAPLTEYIASNRTPEGRARNRAVVVAVHGAQPTEIQPPTPESKKCVEGLPMPSLICEEGVEFAGVDLIIVEIPKIVAHFKLNLTRSEVSCDGSTSCCAEGTGSLRGNLPGASLPIPGAGNIAKLLDKFVCRKLTTRFRALRNRLECEFGISANVTSVKWSSSLEVHYRGCPSQVDWSGSSGELSVDGLDIKATATIKAKNLPLGIPDFSIGAEIKVDDEITGKIEGRPSALNVNVSNRGPVFSATITLPVLGGVTFETDPVRQLSGSFSDALPELPCDFCERVPA